MSEHLKPSISTMEKRKADIENKLLQDKGCIIEIIEQAEKTALI
jgi:hypothetical protein